MSYYLPKKNKEKKIEGTKNITNYIVILINL